MGIFGPELIKNISWFVHTAIPKALPNGEWCDSIICNKNIAGLHHGKPHTAFVGGLIKEQLQLEMRGLEKDRECDFLTYCGHSENIFHFLPLGLFDVTVGFISFLTLRSQLSTLSPDLAEPKFALQPPYSLYYSGELVRIK